MTAIGIKAFRGSVPRISPRLLQPNQAQRAWNCRITAGRLDPVRKPLLVSTISSITGAIRTLYRYRHFQSGVPIENWLVWNVDANVVRSPIANDDRGAFYFTAEDNEPRVSDYATAITGTAYPAAWYALGVPNPTAAPSVTVSGGAAPVETRAYVYTFVTPWGEESGPSPASAVLSGNINGTWALTGLQTAPPNTGTVTGAVANTPASGQVRVTLNTTFGLAAHERLSLSGVLGMTSLNGSHRILSVDAATNRVVVALDTSQTYTSGGTWARESPLNTTGMVKRIYRTAGTNAAFLFVSEIPVATTSYNDTVAGTNLGEALPTSGTLPPPKNLTCFEVLPNGCGVGLAGNELCFSDPYRLYSWPISNRYSFSGRGVALVKAGNSVIVLTDTFPILFTGSDPEAMSPTTIETYAPCVAKRGTVDVGGGALYPSFDGLWLVTPGAPRNSLKACSVTKSGQRSTPPRFRPSSSTGSISPTTRRHPSEAGSWSLTWPSRTASSKSTMTWSRCTATNWTAGSTSPEQTPSCSGRAMTVHGTNRTGSAESFSSAGPSRCRSPRCLPTFPRSPPSTPHSAVATRRCWRHPSWVPAKSLHTRFWP